MKKYQIPYDEENDVAVRNAAWLCTFNDLMTLLMVFFVLIFSLSTLDELDIQSARMSLQSGLGIFYEGRKTSIGIVKSMSTNDLANRNIINKLEDSISFFNEKPEIDVKYTEEGIVISLEESILFKSGSAEINPEGWPVIKNIADSILNKISNNILIKGHTDSDAIHNEKYPSNWELSTARSVNVLRYLIDSGEIAPKRLAAVGYGDSNPLVPNDTAENKRKNRRVELFIMSDESL